MLKKAKTGSWPGGRVPLGYRFEKEHGLQIDENEAPIVRRVFELYVQGQSGSSAIAQELNRSGYRTRTGKKFGRKAVLDILRNVMYRGQFMWQKQAFDSPHAAIIPTELFESAAAILQQRSDRNRRKALAQSGRTHSQWSDPLRLLSLTHGRGQRQRARPEARVLRLLQTPRDQGVRPGLRARRMAGRADPDRHSEGLPR